MATEIENPQVEIEDYLRSEDDEFTELELEVQDNLTVEDSPEYKQDFAVMNGVNIAFETNGAVNETEVPEPEEVTTTRPTSQNPLIKVAVISGITLLFVALIGGVISGSMNALKLSTTKKIEPPQKTEEVAQTVKDESGTDKAALALTRQSMAMEKIRALKAEKEATPIPTPTAVPTSQSVPVRKSAPAPQPKTVAQRPVQRTYRRIDTPSSSVVRPVQSQPVQHQTKAITTAKAPVDPMQQWLAVSNVGSFGANTAQVASNVEGAEGIEGGLGQPKPVSLAVSSKDKQTKKTENPDYGQARVLVGTRSEGKLETPIVWSNNTENQSLSYLIRLTKPLKTSSGSEVLPKDSYLVVQMKGASQSEYIQLQAVSALVNNNGETEEKSIPEGTVLILAKNGKLLKAKSRQGNDLGGTIFSAVLSGVAKASEIQNRPNSQITTSNGFSSSTISNDNKDLLAGFTEGTLGEIVRGIQTNNQRQNQQFQSDDKVFVIEAGKQVQIFVNQTINL